MTIKDGSFLLIVLFVLIPPPPSLFFCPIVLSNVIVCNAEGRPEERGGHDCPHRLEQSSEQSYRE